MLQDLSEHVIFPVYQRFEARASTLAARVATYCGSLDDAAAKSSAQEAWKAAVETWEMAELFQFNLQITTQEGELQRDYVYSWPQVSPCQVDSVIAAGYANNDFDINGQSTDGRGLWAVEYALFSDATGCPDAAADAAILEARCEFAQAGAEDILVQASQYVADWTPGSGVRANDFANAGSPGSAFQTTTNALTSIFHAMFYFDKKLWELKINQTTGVQEVKNNPDINLNCVKKTPCPDALESQYAEVSKEHILNNMAGFEMLFRGLTLDGVDRLGFDDFIISKGGDPSMVIQSLQSSRAMLQGMSGTFRSMVESGNTNDAKNLSKEMKNITGAMKSDVPAVIGLEVPASAAGDGD